MTGLLLLLGCCGILVATIGALLWMVAALERAEDRDAADPDKETPPPGWPGGLNRRRSPAQRARLASRVRGGA